MKAKKLTDEQMRKLDFVQDRAWSLISLETSSALNLDPIRAVIDAYEQMREPEPIVGSVVQQMTSAYVDEANSNGWRVEDDLKSRAVRESCMNRVAHVLLDAMGGKVTDEEREAWNKISRVDASVSSFCHWLINRRIFRMLAPERTPEERVTVRKEEYLPHLLVCIDGEIVGRFGNEQTAQDLREGIIARMKREQGAK